MFGDNELGQLGVSGRYKLSPEAFPITGIKKVAAARNFSVALTYLGDAYVWGENHYGQLGVEDDIVNTPKLIQTGCVDIEAGEGLVALLKEDCILLAGSGKFDGFKKFDFVSRPTQLCVGDTFAAYVDRFGDVYHIGGLFTEKSKRSYFYLQESANKFEKVENGFFPGRVKKLQGKYSYHVAIIED